MHLHKSPRQTPLTHRQYLLGQLGWRDGFTKFFLPSRQKKFPLYQSNPKEDHERKKFKKKKTKKKGPSQYCSNLELDDLQLISLEIISIDY